MRPAAVAPAPAPAPGRHRQQWRRAGGHSPRAIEAMHAPMRAFLAGRSERRSGAGASATAGTQAEGLPALWAGIDMHIIRAAEAAAGPHLGHRKAAHFIAKLLWLSGLPGSGLEVNHSSIGKPGWGGEGERACPACPPSSKNALSNCSLSYRGYRLSTVAVRSVVGVQRIQGTALLITGGVLLAEGPQCPPGPAIDYLTLQSLCGYEDNGPRPHTPRSSHICMEAWTRPAFLGL